MRNTVEELQGLISEKDINKESSVRAAVADINSQLQATQIRERENLSKYQACSKKLMKYKSQYSLLKSRYAHATTDLNHQVEVSTIYDRNALVVYCCYRF